MLLQRRAELIENAKNRVREAFIAFEQKEGSLIVDAKDVGAIIRALGYNISASQATQLLQVIRCDALLSAAVAAVVLL